jgi:hypothetical protein
MREPSDTTSDTSIKAILFCIAIAVLVSSAMALFLAGPCLARQTACVAAFCLGTLRDVPFQVGLIAALPGALAAGIAALALGDSESPAKLRSDTRLFPGDAYSPKRYIDSFKMAMAQRRELQMLGLPIADPPKSARDVTMEALTPLEKLLDSGKAK